MAPPPSIPPPLPPSVEEAYRRKCLQLKRRTNEVEEDNEAARLRLARLRRGVEKLRLERAFILDQLAKRTSTNVEDSEGSPSPPPTPSEKPLRSKRGHRKPSVGASLDPHGPSATFINQSARGQSPSSDALSHSVIAGEGSASQPLKDPPEQRSNGVGSSSKSSHKKPSSAFDLYCRDNREQARELKAEGVTVEEELSRGWNDLSKSQRDAYTEKEKAVAEVQTAAREKADADASAEGAETAAEDKAERRTAGAESQVDADDTPARDEDEDMEIDD
ncbi:unnamed protein product [Discula destructiva]